MEPEYVDLYCRKSAYARGRRRELTMDAQENKGRDWAEGEGYAVRHVYKENLSAYKHHQRPLFDRAMSGLASGEVAALWCYALDRFTRRGAGAVLPLLETPGRRVVFDYEDLDSSRPGDRRRIIDRAEDAREYSEKLSDRIRDVKAEQREQGQWLGNPPFGLTADPETRKLHHSGDWPIVERIFAEAAQGMSQRSIARRLSESGLAAARGGPWRSTTVGKIIRHPVYLGWQTVEVKGAPVIWRNRRGQKVRVFAVDEATIPEALAKRAQNIAAGRILPGSESRTGQPDDGPISGITWCEGCKGRAISAGKSYRCSAHIAGVLCPAPASVLRTGALREVRRQFGLRLAAMDPLDPVLMAVAERWVVLSRPEESEVEEEARVRVKAAEEGVARLDRVFAAGGYQGAEGERTFVLLRREAGAELEEARRAWDAVARPLGDVSVLTDPDRLNELWDGASDVYRGQILRLAVERVWLQKAEYSGQRVGAGRVRIEWAKPRGS